MHNGPMTPTSSFVRLALSTLALVAGGLATGCSSSRGTGTMPTSDMSMPGGFDLAMDVDTGKAVVYAHTAGNLYRVDPDTLAVTFIAAFGWPSGDDEMYDIAIDKNGKMIGITSDAVYAVDVMTAKCTFLAAFQGSVFNGLSFISADQIDNAGAEILVGADTNGDVYKVNPADGVQTLIGNYGSNWGSSGDLVSVAGATYATVNEGGFGENDTLVSVDPKTGKATRIGDTGFAGIYGLGYWKQKLFGFSTSNQFLLIDIATGKGTLQKTGAQSWNGAGVTTAAPTIL